MAERGPEGKLPPISRPTPEKHPGESGNVPEFSGYEITGPLGKGGMGTVWKAVQLSTRREVALKVLIDQAFGSENARCRFQREVELAARLEHSNIVRIYDSGLHHGAYYYAMELINGVPLDTYVRDQRLGQRGLLKLMRIVCEAVRYAHQHGVLHRDLKPSNILVTHDGQPHVVDFGLAKCFLERVSGENVSALGDTVGTPAYMSPEQARGWETDCRSDIFSFGVLWYELLAGRRPFEGSSAAEILSAIITKEPVSVDLLCPEVPTELSRVLHKCLRKELELRYQSMDDLLADLKFLEGVLESRESVVGKKRKSVAVLPFLSLGNKSDDLSFCDGITEDITTDLSKIRDLTVASLWLARSSQAKGLDVCGIGKELGVDCVLQGSVQRAGKRMRVTAQLIEVANGFHLWAEKFDRETEDIFAVQDEIAVAIARALEVHLTDTARDPLQKRGTRNPEAYEAFIKGRFQFWYRNTFSSLEDAERHYRRALQLDPSYAQSWLGLADVYNMLWVKGTRHRADLVTKAQEALSRAEHIDPHGSYGYYARAWYHAVAGNAAHAENMLLRGLEANPDDPVLSSVLGLFQLSRGDIDSSEKNLLRSLKLDPFMHYSHVYLALGEAWYRRDVNRAVSHMEAVLALAPDFCDALRVMAKCHILRGELQQALSFLDKASAIDRPWAHHLTLEAIALAGLNKPEQAMAKIEQAVEENPEPTWGITDQAQALNTTIALSLLNKPDEALDWLERTAHVFLNSQNPRLFDVLDHFEVLAPLRGDRRYEELRKAHISNWDNPTDVIRT